jgi:Lrp/AsnC family leucine-responsive transcriptional regulator
MRAGRSERDRGDRRGGETPRPSLDAIDQTLLGALQGEGRLTNKVLAARVGLSQSACLARVRRLEAIGAIKGYSALIGRAVINGAFECWASIGAEHRSPEVMSQLRRFIAATPAIVEAYELAGPFDIVLHAFVADIEAWRGLEAEIARIAGAGTAVRMGVWLGDLKEARLPPLRLAE